MLDEKKSLPYQLHIKTGDQAAAVTNVVCPSESDLRRAQKTLQMKAKSVKPIYLRAQ